MSVSLLAMSHSPLLHQVEVAADIRSELEQEFEAVRQFVADTDPDFIVLFAPDHYNGFFAENMPPFCIGTSAEGLGDYGGRVGPIPVPEALAFELLTHVLNDDVDLATSRGMGLDHGAVQPLELLYGDDYPVPVIPVFVNGVAPPFCPMRRVRRLGQSIGSWLAGRHERILVIASGGLSHDPPVPQWETATETQRALLLAGRNPTREAQVARQQRVIAASKAFAKGEADIADLNPQWDREFMEVCRNADVAAFDRYEAEEMSRQAGRSSHEVRTWVAAFSTLAAVGNYTITREYYRAIYEFIAGFGIMTARADSHSVPGKSN